MIKKIEYGYETLLFLVYNIQQTLGGKVSLNFFFLRYAWLLEQDLVSPN